MMKAKQLGARMNEHQVKHKPVKESCYTTKAARQNVSTTNVRGEADGFGTTRTGPEGQEPFLDHTTNGNNRGG